MALVVTDIQVSAAATMAAAEMSLCDQAANVAAQNSNVPISVLMSIARVETGQGFGDEIHPWPWSINVGGDGFFFATNEEAVSFAEAELRQGNVNFDVGCFQINLKWHSKEFTSLENAFDPVANAAYAARFLESLFQEHGSWSGAVSAYHSRTKENANTYLGKVKAVWQDLQVNVPKIVPVEPPNQRENMFPLLQSGQGTNGSLVPQKLVTQSLFAPR